MGWSGPRNRFQLRMVNSGRLLLEGQEKGGDERPSTDHDEERQAGHSGNVSAVRDQDLQDRQSDRVNDFRLGPLQRGGPFSLPDHVVIGGSRAASNTSVADTASSTPSVLKISTLEGLLTRAMGFWTLKWRLAICSATRLSSSSAVTAMMASARSMPVWDRNFTSQPSPLITMLPSWGPSPSAQRSSLLINVLSCPRSRRSRDM